MLNDAQLQTLSNHIAANTDPYVEDALASGSTGKIRKWYNAEVSTHGGSAFWVFRESISVDGAVREGIDWETDYDAFDVKDVSVLLLLFHNGTFAIEQEGGRQALAKVCTGAVNSQNGLIALGTYRASEAEKLFAVDATGPSGGNGSAQGSAAIAVVKGDLSLDDVRGAVDLIPQARKAELRAKFGLPTREEAKAKVMASKKKVAMLSREAKKSGMSLEQYVEWLEKTKS